MQSDQQGAFLNIFYFHFFSPALFVTKHLGYQDRKLRIFFEGLCVGCAVFDYFCWWNFLREAYLEGKEPYFFLLAVVIIFCSRALFGASFLQPEAE